MKGPKARSRVPAGDFVRECLQDMHGSTAAEIGFYRGYQAGYSAAIEDAKTGDLKPGNEMKPRANHRA